MEMAIKTATPRMICDMDAPSLGTTVATKRFKPKGGVNIPIERFTVVMMPKWMGSIPAPTTAG